MAQCTDTHLFCKSCVTSYMSTQLGEQNSDLRCMDLSGCKMTFPDSELRRILPEKLFRLYEDIRQRREIEQAGIEGLEECPFCNFRVVIDADFEEDKVLRCQNDECGKESCRKCKKEVSSIMHTGLALRFGSAESWRLEPPSEVLRRYVMSRTFPCTAFSLGMILEMEEDMKLDGKHAVEEAMSMFLFYPSDVSPIRNTSSGSDAQLPQVPEGYAKFQSLVHTDAYKLS